MNETWVLALGAAAFAGFSRGFAAFGTAMIYVPLMTLAFDTRTAVVTLFLIDLVPAIPLVARAWRRGSRATLGWMALGAAALTPVGVGILLLANRQVLELLLGLVLLAATTALLVGRHPRPGGARFDQGRRSALLAGGMSGLAGGICGIFGPPAMIYLLGRGRDAEETRANAILFLTGQGILLGLTYVAYGMVRAADLRLGAVLLPVYAAAVWLGAHGFSRTAERDYRRVVLILLWAMAAVIAARAAWAMALAR